MSMKRHASRLRHMQRRYHRKGRRKAPLGRPPDMRTKLNFIKRSTRTYDFNTIPSTGIKATRWQYLHFVFGRIQSIFQQLELKELHNYKYLQQQRHLYYGRIGIRYKHILPKHKHLLQQPTTKNQTSIDQTQPHTNKAPTQLIHDIPNPFLDPPHWSTTTNIQPQLHHLSQHLPYSHQSLLWLATITLMSRSSKTIFGFNTNSSVLSIRLIHLALSFFGLVIVVFDSLNATSSPTEGIPTYTPFYSDDTFNGKMMSEISKDESLPQTSSYVRRESFLPYADIFRAKHQRPSPIQTTSPLVTTTNSLLTQPRQPKPSPRSSIHTNLTILTTTSTSTHSMPSQNPTDPATSIDLTRSKSASDAEDDVISESDINPTNNNNSDNLSTQKTSNISTNNNTNTADSTMMDVSNDDQQPATNTNFVVDPNVLNTLATTLSNLVPQIATLNDRMQRVEHQISLPPSVDITSNHTNTTNTTPSTSGPPKQSDFSTPMSSKYPQSYADVTTNSPPPFPTKPPTNLKPPTNIYTNTNSIPTATGGSQPRPSFFYPPQHQQKQQQPQPTPTPTSPSKPVSGSSYDFKEDLQQFKETDNSHLICQVLAYVDPIILRSVQAGPHRDELAGDKCKIILEAMNRVLCSRFPPNDKYTGVVMCTKVEPSTVSNNDSTSSYNITIEIDPQANKDIPSDELVYDVQNNLTDLFQNIAQQNVELKKQHPENLEQVSEFWAEEHLNRLFGTLIFKPSPLTNRLQEYIIIAVSETQQNRELNTHDIRGKRFQAEQLVEALVSIDPTGSFKMLATNKHLIPLLISFKAVNFFSLPQPTNKPISKRKANKSKRSSTRGPQKQAVLGVIVRNTPLGQKIGNAVLHLTQNEITMKPIPIKLSNRKNTVIFKPLPQSEEDRRALLTSIYNGHPKNVIHRIDGISHSLVSEPENIPILLDSLTNVEAINPCFNLSTAPYVSAHITMEHSVYGAEESKDSIHSEINRVMRGLDSDPSEDYNHEDQPQDNQSPGISTTANSDGDRDLYGAKAARNVMYNRNLAKWYVVVWSKEAGRLTITQDYQKVVELIHGVRFNHHFSADSLNEALKAVSDIVGENLTNMSDVQDFNIRQPLGIGNLNTEHAPPGLKHLHMHSSSSKSSSAVNHMIIPVIHQEFLLRYNNSTWTQRDIIKSNPDFHKLHPAVLAVVNQLDAGQQPTTIEAVNIFIRRRLKENNPEDKDFTYCEYPTETEPPTKRKPPTAQNETSSTASSHSLPIDDIDMNLSNNNSMDEDEVVESQQQVFGHQHSQGHMSNHHPTDNNKRLKTSTTPPNASLTSVDLKDISVTHKLIVTPIAYYTTYKDCTTTLQLNGLDFDNTTVRKAFDPLLHYTGFERVILCQYGTIHEHNMPTHAIWCCTTNDMCDNIKTTLKARGILNSYTIDEAFSVDPNAPFKFIPEDDDMENPSTIAQMWKLNCPQGQERILYNLIKDKNDEALGRWNHIYHGKQAHSL